MYRVIRDHTALGPLNQPVPIGRVQVFTTGPLRLTFQFIRHKPRRQVTVEHRRRLVTKESKRDTSKMHRINRPIRRRMTRQPSFIHRLQLRPRRQRCRHTQQILQHHVKDQYTRQTKCQSIKHTILRLSRHGRHRHTRVARRRVSVLNHQHLRTVSRSLTIPRRPHLVPPNTMCRYISLRAFR